MPDTLMLQSGMDAEVDRELGRLAAGWPSIAVFKIHEGDDIPMECLLE